MGLSYSNRNSSSAGSSSDRLQKAIERNRAKQAKRAAANMGGRSNLPTENWTLPGATSNTKKTDSLTSGRRSVVTPAEDVEFITNIRKSPGRSPGNLSYTTASTAKSKSVLRSSPVRRSSVKKKNARVESKLVLWGIKGAWLVCGFLILRLVFSSGGVIDYYSNKALLEEREEEYRQLIIENENIAKEITRIKEDSLYQRKLVREHLGYIGRDEYLVLFPKDS